jgi:NAD(P)-dependent dehydrogenase (short-subunit alcohol dehydrogenase family)
MSRWTSENIPRLDGKTILVTGATSGLGLESARVLAQRGATVILAGRSREKAQAASSELLNEQPDARLEPLALDLTDLASIRRAASDVVARHKRLDVLLNNAGVMATPYLRTKDGFELQFGTNHLGHFALTGALFGLLQQTRGARVVSVTSGAHRLGRMRFDDPHWERGYQRWPAYGMSKLANILFTNELARRLQLADIDMLSAAAHPGYANTNLQLKPLQMSESALFERVVRAVNPLFSQSAAMGALPQLYAATSADVASGDLIGPDGLFEARGYPKKVRAMDAAYAVSDMRALWELSERLTGVSYGI